MASIADAVVGAGRGIGRHFSVVGMVPAFLAVAWLWFLLASSESVGVFTLTSAKKVAGDFGLADLGLLIGLAFAFGLITQPFQFGFTQWLEGYWGGGRLSTVLAAHRINRYRAGRRRWISRGEDADTRLIRQAFPNVTAQRLQGERDELLRQAMLEMDGRRGDRMIALDQVSRYRHRYEQRVPERPSRVMPTRLGNALRAFEDEAGRQYQLDATVVAAHLSLLPEEPSSAYVRDTRQTLDLAVRICMMGLLATLPTAVLLARSGVWSSLVFLPFGAAYLAYLGAVHAARAYGSAVRFQIDLRRFALYEALHLPAPATPSLERDQNERLMLQLVPRVAVTPEGRQRVDGLRYMEASESEE